MACGRERADARLVRYGVCYRAYEIMLSTTILRLCSQRSSGAVNGDVGMIVGGGLP